MLRGDGSKSQKVITLQENRLFMSKFFICLALIFHSQVVFCGSAIGAKCKIKYRFRVLPITGRSYSCTTLVFIDGFFLFFLCKSHQESGAHDVLFRYLSRYSRVIIY